MWKLFGWVIWLAFACSPAGVCQIALVHTTTANNTANPITLSASSSVGNWLIAIFSTGSDIETSSVSTDAGESFTEIGADDISGHLEYSIWVLKTTQIANNLPFTNFHPGASSVIVYELSNVLSGLTPTDIINTAVGDRVFSGTSVTNPSLSATNSSFFISPVHGVRIGGLLGPFVAAGGCSGWSVQNLSSTPNTTPPSAIQTGVASEIASGTQSCTWNFTGSTSDASTSLFYVEGSPAPPPPGGDLPVVFVVT